MPYTKTFFFCLFFISGFVLMVFELIGTRILAPYIGSSLSTWTSVIGIILLFLSFGYYIAGIINKKIKLGWIFLAVSLSFIYVYFFKDIILIVLQNNFDLSHNSYAVISSLILFAPASFLIALITPVLSKKIIEYDTHLAKNLGNMYALSAIGSILGTFLTGFVFIPFIGVGNMLLSLAVVMFVVSLFFLRKKILVFVLYLTLFFILFSFIPKLSIAEGEIFSVESSYGRISVQEYTENGNEVRSLYIDNLVHSEMFTNSEILASPYAYYYDLASYLNPNISETLMIGGGAYSYPKHFLKNNPSATIDVVEINPVVTEIAKEYFNLEENKRLNIYHEDGRVFLKKSEKKYDAIYIDAFNGFSIPEHLATREFVALAYEKLSPNGVVIVNIPGLLDGQGSEFTRAEYKTYSEIFPSVDLFLVREMKAEKFQNIILMARKDTKEFPNYQIPEYQNMIAQKWYTDVDIEDISILTDDFAPVDYLTRSLDKFLK